MQEQVKLLRAQFQELKSKMSTRREELSKNLQDMVVASNESIDRLRKKSEQAERLLIISELNRKLESENEKLLPFYEETEVEMPFLSLSSCFVFIFFLVSN